MRMNSKQTLRGELKKWKHDLREFNNAVCKQLAGVLFGCPVTNGKMSQEMIHFPLIDLSGRGEFFNVSLDWTSNQLLEHRLD